VIRHFQARVELVGDRLPNTELVMLVALDSTPEADPVAETEAVCRAAMERLKLYMHHSARVLSLDALEVAVPEPWPVTT
jgi:hypothetical protein